MIDVGNEIHNFFTMHEQKELIEFIKNAEDKDELMKLYELAGYSYEKSKDIMKKIRLKLNDFIHDGKIPFQPHLHEPYMSYSLEDCIKLEAQKKVQEQQQNFFNLTKGIKNDTN